MVEVEFNLVAGGPDRLVAGELQLLDEVLMGILRHLASLVCVEEDVVDVEGGGDKGLLVGEGAGHVLGGTGVCGGGVEFCDGPETFADGSDVEVEFDLVILECDEGQCQSGVAAEPEEQGNVERGFGKCIAWRTHDVGSAVGGAWTGDVGE